MKQKKLFSFTLIEMLIVIVIIGILAAALIPRLQSVQGRARDTKRKADFRTIVSALSIYEIDNANFPIANQVWGCPRYAAGNITLTNCQENSTSGSLRLIGLSGYLTSIPVDPINNSFPAYTSGGNYSYNYGYVFTSPNYYDLVTKLENPNDPDRCSLKQYMWSKPTNTVGYAICGTYSHMIYHTSPY